MAAYLDAAIASALKKAGKDENFRLKAEQRADFPQSSSHCAKKKRALGLRMINRVGKITDFGHK